MAIDYVALKAELQNDPKALGYASLRTAGNDSALASLLNNRGASAESVFAGVVPSWQIVNATDPAEWAALSAQEKQRYQTLTGAGFVDTSNPNVRTAFTSMFSVATGPVTRGALGALASRSASRAEVLFGTGTVVEPTDVARALRAT